MRSVIVSLKQELKNKYSEMYQMEIDNNVIKISSNRAKINIKVIGNHKIETFIDIGDYRRREQDFEIVDRNINSYLRFLDVLVVEEL